MRVLVSNDDGVDAPGIRILAEGLRDAGHEVLIVAPDSIAGMKILGTDPEAGEKLYQKGIKDGQAIGAFVKHWQNR